MSRPVEVHRALAKIDICCVLTSNFFLIDEIPDNLDSW
jgi:hypothetical protein